MAVTRTLSAGLFACLLFAGSWPAPCVAASPTRMDLFDPKANRTGSAVVEGDRVDPSDVRTNRTGSGRMEAGRRVDFFDTRGNRTGYALIEAPGSISSTSGASGRAPGGSGTARSRCSAGRGTGRG